MNYSERCISFACKGEPLLGIVSTPVSPLASSGTAVLIVVGGPQYRAGSHRQFVQLARAVASAGHTSMRFDVRGMGDSQGAQRSFEALSEDVGAAIDALQQAEPALKHLVLMGLCDGASASLMYLHDTRDARVSGLCLLNPWLRSDASLARAHVKHYYVQRLMNIDFWRKLTSGSIGLKALRDLWTTLRSASQGNAENRKPGHSKEERADFQTLMLRGWQRFNGPVLLALSSTDLTAKEFADSSAANPEWRKALNRPTVSRVDLADADHTLSNGNSRLRFEQTFADWLQHSKWQGA